MSAWRATLRIARRDAGRAKGRSALVVAMIALPVLGVGAADVLYRTYELSPDQQATRTMGAADAVLEDTGQAALESNDYGFGGEPARNGPPVPPASVLPLGSRVLVDRGLDTSVTKGDMTTRLTLRDLPYTDPMARGLYRQVSGRAPLTAGEVSVTTAVAARMSLELGAEVRQEDADRTLRVVGVVADASRTDRMAALVPPGSLGRASVIRGVLVDVPEAITSQDVRRANAAGYFVRTRGPVPGQPQADTGGGPDGEALTAVALVVGMALLEVVLLAGPAFAVGAKRQSRELALLAATGGERRDVRRTVLGAGLVLGGVGGLLGAVGGVALAAAALPLLRGRLADVPGPFDVPVAELLGLAAVGVVTAVLAAVLPARTASRQDVVAALTGRRGQVRSLRRTPVIGAVAAVAGAALAMQGARSRDVTTILAGSAVAELGLVAMTPYLVGVVGRIGPRLPLAARMAVRDAARNRGRTAPAVAAVLAAVAGSVAVGTYVASLDRYGELSYTRQAPDGTTVVTLFGGQVGRAEDVAGALRAALPGATTTTVRTVGLREGPLRVDTAGVALVPRDLCSFGSPGQGRPSRAALEAAAKDPLCNGRGLAARVHGLVVGGPAELRAVTGLAGDEYDAVLAKGGAVVPLRHLRPDGTATLQVLRATHDHQGMQTAKEAPIRQLDVPALAAPRDELQATVISPEAARRLGLPVETRAVVASRDAVPSGAEQDRVRAALARLGVEADLYVESGYSSSYDLGLLALVVGSAVIVLGASGIATGLAAADGRADLATLSAVGASPGTRRRLAAFQSAVTAGLGTLLGTAAGLVPAAGMVRALNAEAAEAPFPRFDPYPLVLPWTNLAITVLVVPLVAAGAAALLTRSRLPMVRRLG